MRAQLLSVVFLVSAACAPRATDLSTTTAPTAAPAPQAEPFPPQDPEKWSQYVRPIMAGGGGEPQHLDEWDNAKRLSPGSKVMKNLELLGEDRADTVIAAMQAMEANIGMGCKACHVKGDFAADTKEDKKVARGMIKMAADINATYFDGKTEVSCFTCHKGEDHPEHELPKDAVAARPKHPLKALTVAEGKLPAEQVYKNIEMMKGMEARHLLGVMENFSIALGVSCEFCHDKSGDWADDSNKHKKIARDMSKMAQELDTRYFEGEGEISCWTCHGGKKEPKLRASDT